MTREERIQERTNMLATLESKVSKYNSLYEDPVANRNAISDLESEVDKLVDDINEAARIVAFNDCRESDDPMLTAVTILTYPNVTVRTMVKTKVDGIEVIIPMQTSSKPKYIDLAQLKDYCPDGIGFESTWIHKIQKLNYLMTVRTAKDLKVPDKNIQSISDSYEMSEIARKLEMGETPTSNTKLLEQLQMVVTSMLGDEKVVDDKGNEHLKYQAQSQDRNYILNLYAKKGKDKLSVACSNHSNFRKLIMDVCHRIVLGLNYDVISGAVKKSK